MARPTKRRIEGVGAGGDAAEPDGEPSSGTEAEDHDPVVPVDSDDHPETDSSTDAGSATSDDGGDPDDAAADATTTAEETGASDADKPAKPDSPTRPGATTKPGARAAAATRTRDRRVKPTGRTGGKAKAKAGGGRDSSSGSGRYTPPNPAAHYKPSPLWVPILMFTLFGVGVLMIILNYAGVLPGPDEGSGWYVLGGLGAILAGIITATQLR